MASRRREVGNGFPRQQISPLSIGRIPATASSRVVLPAPFGPMVPMISPARMSKLTSASTHGATAVRAPEAWPAIAAYAALVDVERTIGATAGTLGAWADRV